MEYTINEIAQFAGVTHRTLRYYDKIGLLKASGRTDGNYRIYSENDMERIQQILFFRELDFPLEQIAKMLEDPRFDRKKALELQAEYLQKKAERYSKLSLLAKETLNNLEEGKKMSDKDMFNGFDYDKMMRDQKQYQAEVEKRWGQTEAYAISKERTSKYTKEDWEKLNQAQADNIRELCALYEAGVPADDSRVQTVVEHAHMYINDHFYPCSLEMWSMLGSMYVSDERFTAYYEKFARGLASYYNDAIQHYCIVRA